MEERSKERKCLRQSLISWLTPPSPFQLAAENLVEPAVPDIVKHSDDLLANGDEAGDKAGALLDSIRSVERHLQNHKSVLMCPVQTFEDLTPLASAELTKYIKMKDEERKETAAVATKQGVNPRTGLASTSDVRYKQFDKDQFNINRYGEASIGIDEYGRHGGREEAPPSPTTAGGAIDERSASAVDRKRDRQRKRPLADSSKVDAKKSKPMKNVRPIIMVPPGMSSIINKYNARVSGGTGTFARIAKRFLLF